MFRTPKYEIQTQQPFRAASNNAREVFANDMMQMIDGCDIYVDSIWFTDEAYFYLEDFVNKRNWRIWGTKSPHGYFIFKKYFSTNSTQYI